MRILRSNWMCLLCGTEFVCSNARIANYDTRSCGCLHIASAAATGRAKRTHGHSATKRSPTYISWMNMKARCLNPNNEAFCRYGAIGITVCERWINSFSDFLADMGECPPGLEIDRWPNQEGNYESGNCRWATPIQQARNMSSNRIETVRGRTGCLKELCEWFDANYQRVWARLKLGWSLERAFFEPRYNKGRIANASLPLRDI